MFNSFNICLLIMYIFAVVVFIALYFIPAGYGKMATAKWGFAINNKIGWFMMECPTVIVSLFFAVANLHSSFTFEAYISRIVILAFFITHYLYRSFLFPFLLRGRSKMPISIVIMGAVFNTINASLISWWTFYISEVQFYSYSFFKTPLFIIGTILFVLGFALNIDSDSYIRSLRKKGDTRHYFPQKHLYRFVSSANYLCEIVEWLGFALLSLNPAAFLFFVWTASNLIPRSSAIHKQYKKEFPTQMQNAKIKRIFPFIY